MEKREITRRSLFAIALAAMVASGESAMAWTRGTISQLPYSKTKRIAWTVDDGSSASALGRYVKMLEVNPSIKITFFVLSGAAGWAQYAKRLKALQDRGQIQLANHTFSHRDLTKLSDAKIKAELMACERFCLEKFGKTTKPYFRPPYGSIDARVVRVAASIGFTNPVMWFGSFASGAGVASSTVLKMATKWIANGRIVIDHANGYCTTNIFPKILGLFKARGLTTVTLREAFEPTSQ
jgi:peptidoglycan/xylan/chitin deacetylase (PgdA/CDA1 family)